MENPNLWNLFQFDKPDETSWRRLDLDVPIAKHCVAGTDLVSFDSAILQTISEQAFFEINHYLRPRHLQQLASILNDAEASTNDRYVAFELLKNANIAASGVFPMCQDTGTAIVLGKKGRHIVTTGMQDQSAIANGIAACYLRANLRYSQVSALTMFEEQNTGTNMPAQIDIQQEGEPLSYKLLFIAKGGGSANKSFLFQLTPSMLEQSRMMEFLETQMRAIGTSACPPYHLVIVIGGLSAELTMKTVKLASTGYFDQLPHKGNATGQAWRDLELEATLLAMSQTIGIGAQFGGKYFCHDVRVIRMLRHGASLPVGIGVSCSADRQILAKITPDGAFLEQLEHEPGRFFPDIDT
ncbi:MAG: fumarate hydratase, partial [Pseudomonadota bacterium]